MPVSNPKVSNSSHPKPITAMTLKGNLRRIIKNSLLALNGETVESQSRAVLAELIRDEHLKSATSVGLFMSMANVEVDTSEIIEYCINHEKKVFLPRCFRADGEFKMEFLRVTSMQEIAQLKPEGKFNLRQPSKGANLFEDSMLDLMIVPGVAFTKNGDRLGHGAGFYDRFLSLHKKIFGSSPHLIGIGLHEQLVDAVPTEDHDWKMDRVIIGSV